MARFFWFLFKNIGLHFPSDHFQTWTRVKNRIIILPREHWSSCRRDRRCRCTGEFRPCTPSAELCGLTGVQGIRPNRPHPSDSRWQSTSGCRPSKSWPSSCTLRSARHHWLMVLSSQIRWFGCACAILSRTLACCNTRTLDHSTLFAGMQIGAAPQAPSCWITVIALEPIISLHRHNYVILFLIDTF